METALVVYLSFKCGNLIPSLLVSLSFVFSSQSSPSFPLLDIRPLPLCAFATCHFLSIHPH